MKNEDGTCGCSGNDSLKPAIGCVRCECGGRLAEAQVVLRIISRINEAEEQAFKFMGALQALGADQCDACGDWKTGNWHWGDRCWCVECLKFNQSGPIREDDEQETVDGCSKSIVRFLVGKGIAILDQVLKPYYARISL